MIFKDALAHRDIDTTPARRGNEPCLNCGRSFYDHDGWRCTRLLAGSSNYRFSTITRLNPNARYETASMRKSIEGGQAVQPVQAAPAVNRGPTGKDPTTWKAWQENLAARKGIDCKICGIPLTACVYHK